MNYEQLTKKRGDGIIETDDQSAMKQISVKVNLIVSRTARCATAHLSNILTNVNVDIVLLTSVV